MILEESSFPENLSARNINQILKNIYQTWDEKKFHSLLSRFSLPIKKNIKDYSRGMKTKLGLAVALAHEAQLLILDEPTSGLDPVVREEILEIFMEFIQDESHSVFMSTHIVSDLEKVADYVTFLHQGKIIFSQGKDDLLESFALVKCSPEEFQAIDSSAVRGYRKNSFGVEALVIKEYGQGRLCDGPSRDRRDYAVPHKKGAHLMKGLLLKDLYNLEKQARSLLLVFVFYLVFSLIGENSNMFGGVVFHFDGHAGHYFACIR